MKNITRFPFVFAIFALVGEVSAQTYMPDSLWGALEVARVGPQNLTKVMRYDFPNPVIRRLYKNSGPINAVTFQLVSQQTLSGIGTDTLRMNNLGIEPNQGWDGIVKLLDQNYNEIATIVLFENQQPETPLQFGFPDPFDFVGPAIDGGFLVYYPQVMNIFDPSDQEDYTHRLYGRLQNALAGYDVTQMRVFHTMSEAEAVVEQPGITFNLPASIAGEFCLEWWVTITHDNITPHYWIGELEVLHWGPICFSFMTTDFPEGSMPEIAVFPNPFTDLVTVVATDGNIGKIYVISSTTGQVVRTGRFDGATNPLDLSDLASGMYILSMPGGTHQRLEKK